MSHLREGAPVATHTGFLAVMGPHGHLSVKWNKDEPDEVEEAKRQFHDLLGKGYRGFAMNPDGTTGDLIKEFDPDAGEILRAGPQAGG